MPPDRTANFQVHSHTEGGIAVIDVAGEVDVYTSPHLKSAIHQALAGGHTRVIVNLLQATYLDTTALSVLTAAQRQACAAGGNLGLVYTHPLIEKVFAITGLRETFPIFRTEADAAAAARDWIGAPPRA